LAQVVALQRLVVIQFLAAQQVLVVVVVEITLQRLMAMVAVQVAVEVRMEHQVLLELVEQETLVLIHLLKVMLVEMEGTSVALICKAVEAVVLLEQVEALTQFQILVQEEQELLIQFQAHRLLMRQVAEALEQTIIYLQEHQVEQILEMVEKAQMALIMEEQAALA
jgi:hypothetical protein